MTDPKGVVARADVLWRTVIDGVLILSRGADEPVLLTGSGVALWSALDQPASLADVVHRLARDHQTDRATVESDLAPVVADLVDRGVLVEC